VNIYELEAIIIQVTTYLCLELWINQISKEFSSFVTKKAKAIPSLTIVDRFGQK
jgi:hypothetical protein